GLPAKEPIRVFVGLNRQEPDKALLEKMVQTALDEMDRTQAFTRRYIVIQGATGRGWIEEYSSHANITDDFKPDYSAALNFRRGCDIYTE
ncbi:alpha/beta-hydrolase family protein, partial [Mycobacterium tuberculosis]|nr:alpha/beta-hydrolase family protein [Mycobacterium tuberculosis]